MGVKMDIQKEREAFKAWFKKEYLGIDNLANQGDEGAITRRDYAYVGWQAAKSQAVQEGFVLVEKAKLMQIVGSAAIIEPITRGNPLMRKYKTELDFILSTVRAMIEAQEQKVTEMKINWGMECPRCNHNEAIIHSTAEKYSGYEFMNDDAVNCLKCGNTGEMDANSEDSDIVWNEYEAQKQNHD